MLCALVFILFCALSVCSTDNVCDLRSSQSKIRSYNWSVFYTKANPDGYFRRMIYIVDNTEPSRDRTRLAGPMIRACKNDTIDVYLENHLQSESISLHWHGIHQKNTPWMDGVQQVTQYPILPTQQFHYQFKADKIGTHWYHSHTGGQYTDGLLGMLIVDDPQDPYMNYPEHHMILREWYHEDVEDVFDIFMNYDPLKYNPAAPFVTGLINDKGRYNCTPAEMHGHKDNCTRANFTRFHVSQNQEYRFRIVAAGSQFTYRFSIDQHALTIVAMDGVYIQPYTVQEIFIDIGQRYDVIVNMTQSVDLYWIRVFTANNRYDKQLHQFNAILQYDGASNTDDPQSIYRPSNNTLIDSKPLKPLANNRLALPLKPPPEFNLSPTAQSATKPIRIEYINISCSDEEDEKLDQCFINGIQYHMSKTPTLFSLWKGQPLSIPSINLKLGESVIFIMNNYVPISHPLHIHGHDFYILARGDDHESSTVHFNSSVDWREFNLENPPIRDSFKLPTRSWVAIGFVATNPGSWLFHCHLTFDMEAGMARIINIGEQRDVPQPPADFPLFPTSGAGSLYHQQMSRTLSSFSLLVLLVSSHKVFFP